MRRCQRETQPQTGEPEEFAERSKYDDVAAVEIAGKTHVRRDHIRERFVDDKNAVALPQIMRDVEELCLWDNAAVRIVRVHNNREVGGSELIDVRDLGRVVSSQPGC